MYFFLFFTVDEPISGIGGAYNKCGGGGGGAIIGSLRYCNLSDRLS